MAVEMPHQTVEIVIQSQETVETVQTPILIAALETVETQTVETLILMQLPLETVIVMPLETVIVMPIHKIRTTKTIQLFLERKISPLPKRFPKHNELALFRRRQIINRQVWTWIPHILQIDLPD
jgi:hypothetical protein